MSQKNLAFIIAPGFVALPLFALCRDRSISWFDDFDMARDQARDRGQPILVDFHADWCEASMRIDRDVFGDEAVMEIVSKHFVPCRIDVSNLGRATNQSRRMRHFVSGQGIERFPVCGLFRPDGDRIGLFHPDPREPEALLPQLASLVQGG